MKEASDKKGSCRANHKHHKAYFDSHVVCENFVRLTCKLPRNWVIYFITLNLKGKAIKVQLLNYSGWILNTYSYIYVSISSRKFVRPACLSQRWDDDEDNFISFSAIFFEISWGYMDHLLSFLLLSACLLLAYILIQFLMPLLDSLLFLLLSALTNNIMKSACGNFFSLNFRSLFQHKSTIVELSIT